MLGGTARTVNLYSWCAVPRHPRPLCSGEQNYFSVNVIKQETQGTISLQYRYILMIQQNVTHQVNQRTCLMWKTSHMY